MTIWKYPLDVTWRQQVAMPANSHILSVQFQGNQLCLWAMVDPHQPKQSRTIIIHGTGREFDAALLLPLFTVLEPGGALVWHVFEEI